LDVTKAESIDKTIAQIEAENPNGLAALINNAGMNYIAPFETHQIDKSRQLFEVNYFGPVKLSQLCLPLLQNYKSKSGQNAKIINIGSIGSEIGLPWEYSYHASKFAILGMSLSLRYELEPLGIKVTCLLPGAIKTDLFQKSNNDIAELKDLKVTSNDNYYRNNLSNMQTVSDRLFNSAAEPSKVARIIESVIESNNPPIKKTIGLDAAVIYTLKKLLPTSWFKRLFAGLLIKE
jgi:short-subunit dehydrogenase